MNLEAILTYSVEKGAADVFIVAGLPVSHRIHGVIEKMDDERMMPDQTEALLHEVYDMAGRDISLLKEDGDDDFSFSIPGLSRFRVNAFMQRGSMSAVIRVITFNLPEPEKFNIPQSIIDLGNDSSGMVLVTGPAGSGKSTTLACIIDNINRTCDKHIITLDDPIEFLHRHNTSIVSQREVGVDTSSYVTALRAALRQSPDVVLLGEMRDYETISVAMTAAETGHMLFSTLHTMGAANTIDRIIDVFPANKQRKLSVQLSMDLKAVVSQQLVPTVDGKVTPAFEIMTVTPAISNMIRDNKIPQIDGLLYSSAKDNMKSMDQSLLELYQSGTITRETALKYATNPEMLGKKI